MIIIVLVVVIITVVYRNATGARIDIQTRVTTVLVLTSTVTSTSPGEVRWFTYNDSHTICHLVYTRHSLMLDLSVKFSREVAAEAYAQHSTGASACSEQLIIHTTIIWLHLSYIWRGRLSGYMLVDENVSCHIKHRSICIEWMPSIRYRWPQQLTSGLHWGRGGGRATAPTFQKYPFGPLTFCLRIHQKMQNSATHSTLRPSVLDLPPLLNIFHRHC